MSGLRMSLRSGVSNFASFVGIGAGTPTPKAATTPRFQGIGARAPEAESDEARRARRAELPQDPDDDGDDDDDALEDDDFGADAPEDDDEPEEAEAKRARRVARRARRMSREAAEPNDPPADPNEENPEAPDDEGDPEEEMRGRNVAASARLRERARCAAIFSAKAAASNPNLAAHLAFNTRLSRGEAIVVLGQGGAVQRGQLGAVMGAYAGQRPGAPPVEKPRALSTAESVDRAFAAVTAYRRTAR